MSAGRAPARARDRDAAPIVITGVGLVTAVGFDAAATAAAVYAGASRIQIIPDFATDGGGEARGGVAAGLTDDRSGTDRLLAMAIPALQEALEHAERTGDELVTERGCLLCALPPEDRPSYERFDGADVAELISGASCDTIGDVRLLSGGHTAALRAVAAGAARLRRRTAAFAIVGGVDCLLECPALAWLDRHERLLTDEYGDGFVPGEAAAFLILEREPDARARGAEPLARIAGVGFAGEPAPQVSGRASRGQGISDAVRAALAASGATPIAAALADLNGESYRMREWSLARARALPRWPGDVLHPAENHGDVGAASGATLAALAVALAGRGYLEPAAGHLLVCCAADDGDRAALLLDRAADVGP